MPGRELEVNAQCKSVGEGDRERKHASTQSSASATVQILFLACSLKDDIVFSRMIVIESARVD